MKKLIKIIGGNASGKSTRLMQYVNAKEEDYQEIKYTWNSITKRDPTGTVKTQNMGRLYSDGVFVMGKQTKSGNWVGTDQVLGNTGNKLAHYEMLNWLKDTHNPHTVIAEGYFAIGGAMFTLPVMQAEGLFDEVDCYAFLYNDAQDYLDRTNARSGKSITEADWKAKGSIPPGWASNRGWKKQLATGKLEELHTRLTVLDPLTTSKNYFINKFK